MRLAFRVDASHRIGTGHVMRCFALARHMQQRGNDVVFISRPLPAHLHTRISSAGIPFMELEVPAASPEKITGEHTEKSKFTVLPVISQADDAGDTRAAIGREAPVDWLIVDHYALDREWESSMRPAARNIAVLDDLADRSHDADLLIDATPGREPNEYRLLLPAAAKLLLGPDYAPLHPEFAELREASLARRIKSDHRNMRLLISFGGAENDAANLAALSGLADADLPENLEVEVILGTNATCPDAIHRKADTLSSAIHIEAGVQDMAGRMLQADLAIGAAGTTSWERCCLGLPAVIITTADNQHRIADALHRAGAIHWLGDVGPVSREPAGLGRAVTSLLDDPRRLRDMSRAASQICDGCGAVRLAEALSDGRDS